MRHAPLHTDQTSELDGKIQPGKSSEKASKVQLLRRLQLNLNFKTKKESRPLRLGQSEGPLVHRARKVLHLRRGHPSQAPLPLEQNKGEPPISRGGSNTPPRGSFTSGNIAVLIRVDSQKFHILRVAFPWLPLTIQRVLSSWRVCGSLMCTDRVLLRIARVFFPARGCIDEQRKPFATSVQRPPGDLKTSGVLIRSSPPPRRLFQHLLQQAVLKLASRASGA